MDGYEYYMKTHCGLQLTNSLSFVLLEQAISPPAASKIKKEGARLVEKIIRRKAWMNRLIRLAIMIPATVIILAVVALLSVMTNGRLSGPLGLLGGIGMLWVWFVLRYAFETDPDYIFEVKHKNKIYWLNYWDGGYSYRKQKIK